MEYFHYKLLCQLIYLCDDVKANSCQVKQTISQKTTKMLLLQIVSEMSTQKRESKVTKIYVQHDCFNTQKA